MRRNETANADVQQPVRFSSVINEVSTMLHRSLLRPDRGDLDETPLVCSRSGARASREKMLAKPSPRSGAVVDCGDGSRVVDGSAS